MAELRATYRLQFGDGFGFREATELVPYLADLGVSHIYLPPSFQARKGSTHGYDVVDPTRISDALGGEGAFLALSRAARERGLGIVLDIVPNHMAVDAANKYWSDQTLRSRFFDVDPETGRHRRFFDIDHLAGVRQEDAEVFAETHSLALRLVRDGVVDGLRIDHPDGLADPAGYLQRLRDEGVEHVWVEKILDPGERLRDWPVAGTVGYEFLNDVAALFVDPAAEESLQDLWEEVSGDSRDFGELAYEAKLEQASSTFRPEVERLERTLGRDAPLARDLASLAIYRTYVEPWSGKVTKEDRDAVAGLSVAPILTLDEDAPAEFVTRFQQTTPPVMAKGVEDTAFYRHARLLALNDVGGDPGRFGISVERFHAANLERAERFPDNLLVTQTHDTKRSGDVRARIGALTSDPESWRQHVRYWFAVNAPLREAGAPDLVEEYFIYQTLVGAWPIELERLAAYMEKALREAKRNTNWIEPDEDYERRVKRFCAALYGHRPFLDSFEPFTATLAQRGERVALATLLLKLTVPGVPDIYQGDELPLRSLVDPDNRRPVDWARRRRALAALRAGELPDRDTRKLWLCEGLLALRARNPEAFTGDYEPLSAGAHACAFVRGGSVAVVVAIREAALEDTVELPAGRYRHVLQRGEIVVQGPLSVAELVDDGGLAVLERIGPAR